jgi:hypothetical protein
MLFYIFSGVFVSYTFPIVFAPILIFLFFTAVSEIKNHQFSLKSILPIIIFIVALVISYFTDLRFVLSDKGQYQNFSVYVMNYRSISLFIKSFRNIVWLFTAMFFFDKAYNSYFLILLYFIKIIILICGSTGFMVVLYKYSKKIAREKLNYIKSINFINPVKIDLYLLLLFFVTIALYFLRMLPLGTPRINYFCFIFSTCFVISGVFFIGTRIKYAKYALVPLVSFGALFPAIQGNINELKNTNIDFDQKIYNNVGNVLRLAKDEDLPIIVRYNEFFPASIMEGQEDLMIKAHHLYKPKDSIPVFMIKENGLGNVVKQLKSNRYILINKYSYQIIKKRSCSN